MHCERGKNFKEKGCLGRTARAPIKHDLTVVIQKVAALGHRMDIDPHAQKMCCTGMCMSRGLHAQLRAEILKAL